MTQRCRKGALTPLFLLFALAPNAPHAEPAASLPPTRIVIVGDSTASPYGPERYPRMGWGQVFDRYVDAGLPVLNRAQNGRSTKSFIDQGWFDGVASELRAGDLFLIQFGHNDAKVEDPQRYTDAATDFPANLRRFIGIARARGATPVLMTPVARRQFDGEEPVDTHGAYAERVRMLARSESVPLVDLARLSMDWLRALGPDASRAQYLHVAEQGLADDTHFHERGAVQVACLVAADLKRQSLLDPAHVVRDTDCGARADSKRALATQRHPSQVLREESIAREQPGPHGGNGTTTAYPFFAEVPDLPWFLRKRVLHAGAGIGLHQHVHDEIYYIVSGRGIYTLDGREYDVTAGHALLTRTGSTHALRQVGEEDLVVMISYMKPQGR